MSETTITVEIDQSTDLAYIELSSSAVARTEEFTPEINIDLDDYGVVVGIEILSLISESGMTSIEELAKRYHVASDVRDLLPHAVKVIEDWTRQKAVVSSAAGQSIYEFGVLRPAIQAPFTPCS